MERRSVHAWATFSVMSMIVVAVTGFAVLTADSGATSIGEAPAGASVAIDDAGAEGGSGELALAPTSTGFVGSAPSTSVDSAAGEPEEVADFEWVDGDQPVVALVPGSEPVLLEAETDALEDLEAVGPLVPKSRRVSVTPELTAEPVGLRISSLDVVAQVNSVGLEDDGSMEIPDDILDVGWYDLGPRPGEAGSAVLAGHVDGFPARAGAFYSLRDIEIGSRITVDFDDGTSSEWVAIGVKLYEKQELPVEELFRDVGPTSLALITCGGAFDQAARSYEHNLVVIAEPARPDHPAAQAS